MGSLLDLRNMAPTAQQPPQPSGLQALAAGQPRGIVDVANGASQTANAVQQRPQQSGVDIGAFIQWVLENNLGTVNDALGMLGARIPGSPPPKSGAGSGGM